MLRDAVAGLFHGGHVVALQRFAAFLQGVFHGALVLGRQVVAMILEGLLGLIDQRVELVPGLDRLAPVGVLLGVRLGVVHHVVHFVLGQPAGAGDGDFLLLAGAEVLGLDADDAVGVDVERYLDLRHAARCGRDAFEVEAPQGAVALRHFALALQDVNLDARLVIGGGGERLALALGNGGVALDQPGHDAAEGLDAQRQRRHVQQQHVLHVAGQHAALHRSAHGHHLVRVHRLVRRLAEEALHLLLHQRHAGGAANQHHLVDAAGRQVGVLQRLLARLDAALDEVLDHLLEPGAAELGEEVFRAAGVGGDEGQVDLAFGHRRQFALGLLGGFLQALHGHGVAAQVDALVALEFVHQPVNDALVEIVAAEMGVAVGGFHLDDVVADVQDGDVESAAAEVVHGNGFVGFFVKAVSQGRGGGFVDDALDVQPGDLAGVLGGLPLAVVEVGGGGDDGLCNLFAQVILGGFFELLQHHGRNFRRRKFLVVNLDARVAVAGRLHLVGHHAAFFGDFVEAASHEAFDRIDCFVGIGNGLAACDLPHQAFPVLGEGHDGRGDAVAFAIGDNGRFAAFHHRHDRVGGSQVDSNDLAHDVASSCKRLPRR